MSVHLFGGVVPEAAITDSVREVCNLPFRGIDIYDIVRDNGHVEGTRAV